MRVPYSWLREYVDSGLSAGEVAEKLTMAGIAVETVELPVPGLWQIVVGRILEITPHPKSERLFVCKVDVGEKVIQVVSGAPNIEVGVNVAVAPAGTSLPGGSQVEVREFQGVESEGLLCSGAELGTDEWGFGDDQGVLVLKKDLVPGTSLDQALGLDDQILEFDLTPNRGDCLAVINIAREVCALTGAELRLPRVEVPEIEESIDGWIQVEIREPSLCRRYAGRIVKNVKVAPSPDWLQYRLRASGIRPINNIVDVTNYVMLEFGQPLHAFDYETLQGGKIVVRKAAAGEQLVTLDGATRNLDEEMLVIADAREPVALGGIMGGLASEVTERTRTVFLEAAYFDSRNIRRTSKLLGLRTESSQRFEKGINIEGVVEALNRAAQLIALLGAGEIVSGVVDEYVRPAAPVTIRLRVSRVNKILGTNLERADVQKVLERLGFCCELCGTDFLLVGVPPYRVDVSEEIDLIEEVARVYGYDRIPSTIPVGILSQGRRSLEGSLRDLTARVMVECGLDEVITLSFTGEGSFDKLRVPKESKLRKVVRIQNPLREEHGLLRTLLLPGLIETVASNCKRRLTNLGIFEMGVVFEPAGEKNLPEEKLHLGIAVCGKEDRGWQEPPGERDFYYVKGALEALFEALGIKDLAFVPWPDFPPLHPGRAAQVLVNGQEVGFIGELHPDVQENFELPVRVCVSELDLTQVFPFARPVKVFEPIPRYPGVERDLAVIVSQDVPAEQVTRVIMAAGGDLLRECRLFDVYQGPQVPPGCRSLAYSLLFQSLERTLTDEEVSEIHRSIVEALEREVGGRLR